MIDAVVGSAAFGARSFRRNRIGTATDLGDGNFEFVDPDWTSYSACFYRIVVP